jgi:hypothetical protein
MPFGAIFINAFREAFHISGHEEGFERVESPRGWGCPEASGRGNALCRPEELRHFGNA